MLPLSLLARRFQIADPNLIAPLDDVEKNYSLVSLFRRTATEVGRA
jgi:hypothetical protein